MMTTNQALMIVDEACARMHGNRADHLKVQAAIARLKLATEEKPAPVEADLAEEPSDETH